MYGLVDACRLASCEKIHHPLPLFWIEFTAALSSSIQDQLFRSYAVLARLLDIRELSTT